MNLSVLQTIGYHSFVFLWNIPSQSSTKSQKSTNNLSSCWNLAVFTWLAEVKNKQEYVLVSWITERYQFLITSPTRQFEVCIW